MELTPEIRKAMDESVLCWLATAEPDGTPNVSPKEVFAPFGTDRILIANIASPQSVRNIRSNPRVCVSFIDILVQKGYQLKGMARIVGKTDPGFPNMEAILLPKTEGKFPFATVTEFRPETAKPILAPSYLLFPETTEAEQREIAIRTYGLRK